jgi:hypothetical protein
VAVRIVSLNIQLGGGERVDRIGAALRDLNCDAIVLSEVGPIYGRLPWVAVPKSAVRSAGHQGGALLN